MLLKKINKFLHDDKQFYLFWILIFFKNILKTVLKKEIKDQLLRVLAAQEESVLISKTSTKGRHYKLREDISEDEDNLMSKDGLDIIME